VQYVQGAIITAQGIGAALSTAVAGFIVVHAGYSVAFLALGGIATIGVIFYLFAMPETQGAAGTAQTDRSADAHRLAAK
jgi:MFS family permease